MSYRNYGNDIAMDFEEEVDHGAIFLGERLPQRHTTLAMQIKARLRRCREVLARHPRTVKRISILGGGLVMVTVIGVV